MSQLVKIYNGATPTTAVLPKVTTGTAIKTLLQVQADRKFKIVEWGIQFDGTAAATPIPVELIETDVAATVTAAVEADLVKYGDPDAEAVATELGILVGTAATGYTASAEGSITATRMFDHQEVAPTNQFLVQYPLGREPLMNHDTFLRIRTDAATAVNASCYVLIEI